jgi:hypothetical protein
LPHSGTKVTDTVGRFLIEAKRVPLEVLILLESLSVLFGYLRMPVRDRRVWWRVHASVSRGRRVSIEIAMPIEVLRLLQTQ